MKSVLAAILITAAIATSIAPVAEARRFGIPSPLRHFRSPLHKIVPDALGPLRALRRAVGHLTVSVGGIVILNEIHRRDRRVFAERTERIVRSDPEHEVAETYELSASKKSVTQKASPVRPAKEFEDDPALTLNSQAPTSAAEKTPAASSDATVQKQSEGQPSAAPETAPAPVATEPASPLAKETNVAKNSKEGGKPVNFDALPAETPCRKVETKLAPSGANGVADPSAVKTNVVIICETKKNDWQQAAR